MLPRGETSILQEYDLLRNLQGPRYRDQAAEDAAAGRRGRRAGIQVIMVKLSKSAVTLEASNCWRQAGSQDYYFSFQNQLFHRAVASCWMCVYMIIIGSQKVLSKWKVFKRSWNVKRRLQNRTTHWLLLTVQFSLPDVFIEGQGSIIINSSFFILMHGALVKKK